MLAISNNIYKIKMYAKTVAKVLTSEINNITLHQ